MIRHMRHGSSPRLMALQSILSPNRRESLPTPSAGVRVMRLCTSSLRRKECSGKCLTTSLWPERAGANSLTSPISSMRRRGPARAGAGRPDPADGAQVALRQLRFALGREHFGDVEHLRKRCALGGLVLRGVQEVLADDEPVALASHALRPAIEAGFLPEVVQRGL